MLWLGCAWWLAQPDQSAALGAVAQCQKPVKGTSVMFGQRCGQCLIHMACAACECLAAYAINDINRRYDDALSQQFDQCLGQHDTSVGLLGQLGKMVDKAPIIGNGERGHVQPRLQLYQVLAPGHRSLGILRPNVWLDVQLPPNDCQQ